MAINLEEFCWLNKSDIVIENDKFFIKSLPHSDFICSPVKGNVIANAPFLYKEVEGDFVINACVKPTFQSVYDACAVFAYVDDKNWLKIAFEYTDLGTHSIVTVATENYSDDANGVDINENAVFLQIIRKNNVFVCHYSTDGIEYKMARILRLNAPAKMKIGVAVQSPTGEGQLMEFSNLKITKTLPADIRKSM